MFESITRGWSLQKASFKVLKMDKEILALPLLAGVMTIAAVLALGFGLFLPLYLADGGFFTLLAVFVIYVAVYAVSIFFNAAVIEMATIRFNGGDPVIKDGLSKAWSRIGRILQWAVVAATVGLIFRILRDQAKDNILARILVNFLEFGWGVAVFFVVPIAIFQDVGPLGAIKGSMGLMKRTWGESLAGVATTTIIFFLAGLLGLIPLLFAFLLAPVSRVLASLFVAVAVVYWIILAAVNSAVDGILVAGLYKYAQEGTMPAVFTDQGIRAANLAW